MLFMPHFCGAFIMPKNNPYKVMRSIDCEGGLFVCWEWLKHKDKDGYGRLRYQTKRMGAHQWSYLHHVGLIPDGMFVCHSCDNPSCCNPMHLWLGTTQENTKDRDIKNRYKPPFPKGSLRPTKGRIRKRKKGTYSVELRHKYIGTFRTREEAEKAIQVALEDWQCHLD
jgi:hypothetical protein